MARPNTMYLDLLREVQRRYEPGEWVAVTYFANPASAFVSRKLITSGKRPVPGGLDQWEFEAHKEQVDGIDGERLDGSVLYARWIPETKDRTPEPDEISI